MVHVFLTKLILENLASGGGLKRDLLAPPLRLRLNPRRLGPQGGNSLAQISASHRAQQTEGRASGCPGLALKT